MRRAYRVEVQPTKQQVALLLRHAGCARWAYNWGLVKCKEAHQKWVELGKPKKWDGWLSAYDLINLLSKLKKLPLEEGGVPWMKESSKWAPQEALTSLEKAFKNFLSGRGRYPRFKSRKRGVGSFTVQETPLSTERQIALPVIGRIRIKPGHHGYFPVGKHKSITVSERCGRWYASTYEHEDTVPGASNGNTHVGLDMGVAQLATLSDGTVIPNPRSTNKHLKKMKRLQRAHSRKKKGSNNRKKAQKRVARLHRKIANIRSNYLHQVTSKLTKNHGSIAIEDLNVKGMTSSGGSRKKGLNRSLSDASFGEFRRQLEYKGFLYGCKIIPVNPAYSSQKCSKCGHVSGENRLTQSEFKCTKCGYEANADLNAAVNISVAGSCPETQNACGEVVSLGSNQADLSEASICKVPCEPC